jgi:hypothetical protein
MKKYTGVKVRIHAFVTPPLDQEDLSVSRPSRYIVGKRWEGD